ncbi:hypothetical protein KKG22_05915 [Patescibacteria group bacterium]|nr:hypothetical protein [Patescibacteria group bacterium]
MIKFEDKYFINFNFDKGQIKNHFENATKDLKIAEIDKILDVKFNYAYSSLIKAGLALLSFHQVKIKSVPGHQIKIIEKLAEIIKNDAIYDIGNVMRSKRNIGMYAGGIEVTEKECKEYIIFVKKIIAQVKAILNL